MAGIGFELRHLLRKNTLTSLIQAYAYAGVIGSGPWVFSIATGLAVPVWPWISWRSFAPLLIEWRSPSLTLASCSHAIFPKAAAVP